MGISRLILILINSSIGLDHRRSRRKNSIAWPTIIKRYKTRGAHSTEGSRDARSLSRVIELPSTSPGVKLEFTRKRLAHAADCQIRGSSQCRQLFRCSYENGPRCSSTDGIAAPPASSVPNFFKNKMIFSLNCSERDEIE